MSTYEISKQQKDEYFGRGYTGLPGAVSPELLKRLQNMAEKFEKDIMDKDNNNVEVHGACITCDPVGRRLARYNDVYAVDPDTTLDLLASPGMMAIFLDTEAPARTRRRTLDADG